MALLDHFSHDHPLMLISELPSEAGNEDLEVLCDGCRKPISSSAYSCVECKYFLHEKCANLRRYINHPKHEAHLLKLFPKSPYSYGSDIICSICRIDDWKWFTYHCSICQFDVHLQCFLDKGVDTHESHPHQLTVVPKKASFYCDACGTKEEDNSLICNTCGFWIHKSCATSPTTIQHSDHEHPLLLNFFLPYENRTFTYTCDICRKFVDPNEWVYNCYKCRYFAHLKCVTSDEPSRSDTGDIIPDDPTITRFPLTVKESTDLLNELLNEVSLTGSKSAPKIDHSSHDHPLTLFDVQTTSVAIEEELIICDCCILPITSATPYYGCGPCNYFLHKSCTDLPPELQHPCHPDHLLMLYAPQSFVHNILCNSCHKYSNGFFYKCNTCEDYCLDITCAFFPKIIKHAGHKHPMQIELNDTNRKCKPCDKTYKGLGFVCNACDFRISIQCARFPTRIKHDWDDHPLTLSYPPYSDHPDAFFCEDCEMEMFPKSWAYRSSNGVGFYHTYCICPYDDYSRTKFGSTLTVENHPHPLTFVRKSKNKHPSPCDRCGKGCKGIPVAECAPCNFVIARGCCTDLM